MFRYNRFKLLSYNKYNLHCLVQYLTRLNDLENHVLYYVCIVLTTCKCLNFIRMMSIAFRLYIENHMHYIMVTIRGSLTLLSMPFRVLKLI